MTNHAQLAGRLRDLCEQFAAAYRMAEEEQKAPPAWMVGLPVVYDALRTRVPAELHRLAGAMLATRYSSMRQHFMRDLEDELERNRRLIEEVIGG